MGQADLEAGLNGITSRNQRQIDTFMGHFATKSVSIFVSCSLKRKQRAMKTFQAYFLTYKRTQKTFTLKVIVHVPFPLNGYILVYNYFLTRIIVFI